MSDLKNENMNHRARLAKKQRIVVKVGSSSLIYPETGRTNYHKIDILARELCNLKNQGKEVILVTSGAAAVGREAVRAEVKAMDSPLIEKQAFAAIGQARLMMIYQKSFTDYNQIAAQVLMTKYTVTDELSKYNLHNTFTELLRIGVIPIVNENDSVATTEFKVGDNDTLSAIVASLMEADLLILLSDVNGLYSDDPRRNPEAEFIEYVPHLTEDMMHMGKGSTGSNAGTGGMSTKMQAARIATRSGCDMMIVNGENMDVIGRILSGENIGTLFRADRSEEFDLKEYIGTM